jgi:hypothetical protein
MNRNDFILALIKIFTTREYYMHMGQDLRIKSHKTDEDFMHDCTWHIFTFENGDMLKLRSEAQ